MCRNTAIRQTRHIASRCLISEGRLTALQCAEVVSNQINLERVVVVESEVGSVVQCHLRDYGQGRAVFRPDHCCAREAGLHISRAPAKANPLMRWLSVP